MEILAWLPFIAYVVWLEVTEKRRKADYQKTIENVGLRFHSHGGRELEAKLNNLRQTQPFKNKTANVVEYNHGSLQAFLFQLRRKVNKRRLPSTQHFIALFSSEINWPDFFVRPETSGEEQRSIPGTAALKLITNDGSFHKFLAEGSDEQAIQAFFTTPILEFVCKLPSSVLESNNGMILYRPSSPKPVRLQEASFLWRFFGGRRGPIRYLREEFHMSEFPGTPEQAQTIFSEVDELYQRIRSVESIRPAKHYETIIENHLELTNANDRSRPQEAVTQTTKEKGIGKLNVGKLDFSEPRKPADDPWEESSWNHTKDDSPFIIKLLAVSILYGIYAVPCWLLSLMEFEPWGWKMIPDWAHYTLVLVIPAAGIVWSYASNNHATDLKASQQSQNEKQETYHPRETKKMMPAISILVAWFFYGIYSLACWLLTQFGFSPWGWQEIPIGIHVGLIIVLPIAAMIWLGRVLNSITRERKVLRHDVDPEPNR